MTSGTSSDRRAIAASVLLVATLVAAGCADRGESPSPVPSVDGQLPAGQLRIHECVIAQPGAELLLGDIVGPAGATLTVESITLNGLTGLEISEMYLLDPAYGDPIASATEIPTSEPIWEHRVDAVGAVLQPGDVRNLLLKATVDADVAGFDSITIGYSVGESSSTVDTLRSFKVASACG
ncbi:MAG TPA: hypothetical protein VGO65_03100 [Pseudolysinimonas sp.]|nr:hypothetical protein [Pseudolysinimonas sp.]